MTEAICELISVRKHRHTILTILSSPFGNSISRIDLNNHDQGETKILIKKLHEAIGLALDIENEQMYFTDLAGSVYTAKMDGSDEKVLLPDVGDLTGIAICSTE